MNTFKQELSAHPRGNIVSHKKKALIIGATGATGTQLLSLLLESDNWDKITTITRKPVLNGENHKKLNQIVIDSFDNLKIAYEKKQKKRVDAILCNTPESFGEDKRHVVLIHDKNTTTPLKDISLDHLCFTLIESSLAGHLKKSSKMLQ